MEKNWERFAKVISQRLVIDDGPLYPTHMYIYKLVGAIYTQLVSYRLCRQHTGSDNLHIFNCMKEDWNQSLSNCYLLNLMDAWEFVHTPEITSSNLDLHQGLEGDICIPLTLSCFVGHYEPASTHQVHHPLDTCSYSVVVEPQLS
jgi:hypothetical protein